MIRPLTCVCALLAGASGLYLYSEKHRTTLLDQQISRVVADTHAIRDRTAMLRAEWALLNQPDRLQGLSTRFLPRLQPMAPTQFVQLASLAARLPAVAPETPPHPIATPQTAPALVGLRPAAPGAVSAPVPGATPDGAPAADGVAIAAAGRPARPAQRPAAAVRLAEAVPAAPRPTRSGRAAIQLAANDAAPHRAASRPTPHDALAREVAAHWRLMASRAGSQPVVQAASARAVYSPSAGARPAMGLAGGYGRPVLLPVAAWRPVRPAAVAPSPYAPAAGSSLGSAHGGLAAPVPLPDGD